MSPRAKTLLGWAWLTLAVPAGVAAVLLSNSLGAALAARAGIKVSPQFTGGETAAVIDHGAYRTIVHRPVFDGLFWQWPVGFVQVDWEPAEALPGRLRDEIDLFGTGARGFYINLDTASGAASYENPPDWVRTGPKPERLRNSWAIRVRVKNPGKGQKERVR